MLFAYATAIYERHLATCRGTVDIIERSFRDILAVTKAYQDPNIRIPDYEHFQRMSDSLGDDDDLSGADADYLATLAAVKSMEF